MFCEPCMHNMGVMPDVMAQSLQLLCSAHMLWPAPAALVGSVANVLANMLAGNLNAILHCILQSLTFASL